MTKDEILEKSRNENKGFDEREQQTRIMAGNISQSFGVFLCLLTSMINRYFDGPRVVTIAVLMIYVGMGAMAGVGEPHFRQASEVFLVDVATLALPYGFAIQGEIGRAHV